MTREEAMKNIQEILDEATEEEDSVCYVTSNDAEALRMAIESLKAKEWIPCGERLPSDNGNYLITVADLRLGHIGEHTVTMADFYAKKKKWNSVADVYAWMPLPEPYKEESE